MKALIGKTLQRVVKSDDKYEHLAWSDRIKILDIYGRESGAGMYPSGHVEDAELEVLYINYNFDDGHIGFVDLPDFRELLGCFAWQIVEEDE